jgi:hypothetical protein
LRTAQNPAAAFALLRVLRGLRDEAEGVVRSDRTTSVRSDTDFYS